MGRITVEVDDELEKEFRIEVGKKFGVKKGNLQIAMKEILRNWIDQNKKEELTEPKEGELNG